MLYMNTWEIDEAVQRFASYPVLSKAARFLAAYRDEVDEHSDGWAYWSLPVCAARKLMTLIRGEDGRRGRFSPTVDATEAELKAALTPIKAFYTRSGNEVGMKFPAGIVEQRAMDLRR